MDTLLRYCLVGVSNTMVAIAVMYVFAIAGCHYSVYSTLGYLAAFTSSYILNGLFTFKVGSLDIRGFVTFLSINSPLLILVNMAQVAMIEGVGVPEWMGVAVSAVFYTGVGFLLNRRITFRQSLSP